MESASGGAQREEPDAATAPSWSLSKRIFGIDWEEHLPRRMKDGVTFELASLDESLAFAGAHYARIFGSDPTDARFFTEASTPAKLRFLSESDRFVFRDEGETIGLLIGHPVDWSTYYWRSVAILPEHQGRGLLAAALELTDQVMRAAGVARIEGEAAPVNYRQVRLLMRLGYCVTGSVNSERWGTLLRLTKYLSADAEGKFVTQFCRDTKLAGRASIVSEPQPEPQLETEEGGRHEEVRHRNPLSLHLSRPVKYRTRIRSTGSMP